MIPLLLCDIGPDSSQVDEDGKALQVGYMMERSGGNGRQAIRRRHASRGGGSICISSCWLELRPERIVKSLNLSVNKIEQSTPGQKVLSPGTRRWTAEGCKGSSERRLLTNHRLKNMVSVGLHARKSVGVSYH